VQAPPRQHLPTAVQEEVGYDASVPIRARRRLPEHKLARILHRSDSSRFSHADGKLESLVHFVTEPRVHVGCVLGGPLEIGILPLGVLQDNLRPSMNACLPGASHPGPGQPLEAMLSKKYSMASLWVPRLERP